jgi:indole-3-glycerol phosphate synthase
MTILDKIAAHKRREVAARREVTPLSKLADSEYFAAPTVSFTEHLRRPGKVGIIAEIKRQSPSKGVINAQISVEKLSAGYVAAGASALSVLTDKEFFGGSLEDLQTARRFNSCPLLRKDFILDEYQVVEARASGADVILLIAAMLDAAQVKALASLAASLGLEVLLEIHSREELPDDLTNIHAIGVNNRDLRDFSVDVCRSHEIAAHLPPEMTKIAESGLQDAATILALKRAGFQGFLIGEAFMRHAQPEAACKELIQQIKRGRL